MTNTPLQNTLLEIINRLEACAANVGAMETALVARGLLTFEATDSHRPNALQNVKSELANARWMTSQLPN